MRGGADVVFGWLGGGRSRLASEGTYSWAPSCSSPFPSSPSSPTEPSSESPSLLRELLGRSTVSDCGAGESVRRHSPEMPLSLVLVFVLLTSLVSITFPSSSSIIQP